MRLETPKPLPTYDEWTHAHLGFCGFPERHLVRVRSETWPLAAEGSNAERWGRTARLLLRQLGKGSLIGLVGQRGPGKTQMAVCVAATFKSLNVRRNDRYTIVRYTTAGDLFRSVKATFKHETETEKSLFDAMCKPDLLIIDEAHERAETQWENTWLTNLIDARYATTKHDTILIANTKASAIEQTLGRSIVDRMRETGAVIECNWASFRRAG